MRITSLLFYRVHNIPYRFRGKYGKIKKPTMKDLIQMEKDLRREEQNMLILRHPYLTIEQDYGHMTKMNPIHKMQEIIFKSQEEKNLKFGKRITIADRLNHLKVAENWD